MPGDDAPAPLPPLVVADSVAAFRSVHQGLGTAFSAVHAADSQAAKALIQPTTPAVLCGAHFDDGRMFDLLRWLKATPALAGIPFLVTRVGRDGLDEAMYESVKVASSVLGGNGFLDLHHWRQTHGQEEAARRLVERLRALVD